MFDTDESVIAFAKQVHVISYYMYFQHINRMNKLLTFIMTFYSLTCNSLKCSFLQIVKKITLR